MEKLIGIVVTFCPDESIRANVASYIGSVQELIIVDNTPGRSPVLEKLFSDSKASPRVTVLFNEENVGIARALNQGLALAVQKNYNWALTMDQDSRFSDGLFFEAFEQFKDASLAVFAPGNSASNSYEKQKKVPVGHPLIVMTSGSILNLDSWQETGGFDEKLFIDEVDHDYCLRVLLKHKTILQFSGAVLEHQLGRHKAIRLFGWKRYIHFHSPERTYYIFRNNFYMFRKYSRSFSALMRQRKLILLRDLLIILLFAPQKWKHLRYATLGARHFWRNVYGQLPVSSVESGGKR